MSFLDILFPKKCVLCKKFGSYLCSNCFSEISFDVMSKCLVCEGQSMNGLTHPKCEGRYTIDGTFSAVAYKRGVKKLVYQFKYAPYLSDLQTVLLDLLYENLIQQELFMGNLKNAIFIPIPLTKAKLCKRGYNQAEILSKGLAKRFGMRTQNLLNRSKETRPQYGLKREERIENVKGAFTIFPKISMKKNQTIFLVDDVLTTGSTLKEGAQVLKRAGYKTVYGVTFAQD